MKKEIFKILPVFQILVLLSFLSAILFAQDSPTQLVLKTPINGQIVGGKAQRFAVQMADNQTARIEVEQKGIELSLAAYDPSGSLFLETQSPSGREGNEVMLLTSAQAGEYFVEVKAWSAYARTGKFSIELTEIRQTLEEDHKVNQAAKDIVRIYAEVNRADQTGKAKEKLEAIGKAKQIIKLAKVKKDRVWEAMAWRKIGLIEQSLGELQNALNAYSESLKIWRELKNEFHEGVGLNSIGSIWFNVGDYEKSIFYRQESLKIATQQKSRISQSAGYHNIGVSYLALGQPEKAIEYLELKALPIVQAIKFLSYEGSLRLNLGAAYVKSGNYHKGIENMQTGLELQKKVGRVSNIVIAQAALGKTFLEAGQTEKAFDILSEGLLLADKIGSRQYLVRINYDLALIERRRGNSAEAIRHIEKALEIIENSRDKITNKKLRTSYFSTVQDSYELYTELLIERAAKEKNSEDISRAFEISERSRSRSLIDLLEEAKVDFRQTADRQMIEREKDLIDEINEKYQARERLFGNKPQQEKIDKITLEINALELDLDRLILQIRQTNPQYADLTGGKTLSAADVRNLLDEETVLLEYKLGKERSFLWLLTANSISYHELPKGETIETKARRFYDLVIENKKETDDERQVLSKHLSEILLGKVEAKIDGKRIAVVADGILQYLPFSALYTPSLRSPESEVLSPKPADEKFLVETNEIIVLPSASVLARLREKPTAAKQINKKIAIFADPVFDREDSRIAKISKTDSENQNTVFSQTLRDFRFGENLPRLLASRQEARNISKFVGKNNAALNLGFDANLENIENADLSDYRILHFATHGLLNTSRPELSGLVFSLFDKNGAPQDGFLSLNDIYNLDISSDMVVLSACQTALGKDVRGEGLIGISRGFLYAGTNRIVASLWKVDDSATAEFMKLFYKNHLENKMSASAALRQAKIEMKKTPRFQSPYYWSAFTLLGDWQ